MKSSWSSLDYAGAVPASLEASGFMTHARFSDDGHLLVASVVSCAPPGSKAIDCTRNPQQLVAIDLVKEEVVCRLNLNPGLSVDGIAITASSGGQGTVRLLLTNSTRAATVIDVDLTGECSKRAEVWTRQLASDFLAPRSVAAMNDRGDHVAYLQPAGALETRAIEVFDLTHYCPVKSRTNSTG